MKPALPPFAATSVGSLPHLNAPAACAVITRHLPVIPAWPQLPRRSPLEAIYTQFSPGFPGLVREGDRFQVARGPALEAGLEELYARYLAADVASAALPPEFAAGLAHFRTLAFPGAVAVKGQVIGPVSWGLTLTDTERRAVLYDEILADALARHLRLSAAWQEQTLAKLAPATIVFVDEPYLASFGSAYVPIERDQVLALMGEVLGGLHGLTGTHCCGNTDWPLLLAAPIDILNFDAYNFAGHLALYPRELRAFLDRGGRLAWGIVPVASDGDVYAQSAPALVERLEAGFGDLAARGVPLEQLRAAALLTPACGLGTLTEAGAERALGLLVEISDRLQQRYA